jgi:hypothetical protein
MAKVKPTLDMDLGRHARKAVQVIRDRGHTIRQLENKDGNVCLLGAMRRATAPMGPTQVSYLQHEFNMRFGRWMEQRYPVEGNAHARHIIRECEGIDGTMATLWNDRVLLTADEACAWLEKFADEMDPQRP